MQIKQLSAGLLLATVSAFSQAAVLYDVSFASPPNVNGQSIVIDGTPRTPSRVNMGVVEMQAGFAGQSGNWAVFHQLSCGYDQLEFKLPAGLSKGYLQFDLVSESLNSSQSAFSVHLDSSNYGARSIGWHGGSNQISLFNYGKSSAFGAFTSQQKYHVQVHVDAQSDLLEIEINGNQVHQGAFGSPDLSSIRMTLSPWTGGATNCDLPRVAVSNVLVYEAPGDLQPPVAATLGVNFSLRAGYPNVVPASGGYIRHSRSLSNLSQVDKPITYWISTSLPDGSGFPLLTPRTLSVPAGGTLTELKNFSVPAWFPVGTYTARLVLVDPATGERVYGEIPFSKSAN